MTEVVLFKNANHIVGFECIGHSGFARRGKDIVCAAISTLTITTVNALDEIAHAQLDVKADDKRGHLYCKLCSEPDEITDALLGALDIGLQGVADNYDGKYCKVTYEEEKLC